MRASKKAHIAAFTEWASSTQVTSGCEEREEYESVKSEVSQRVWQHFASSIRSIAREVKYTTCQKSRHRKKKAREGHPKEPTPQREPIARCSPLTAASVRASPILSRPRHQTTSEISFPKKFPPGQTTKPISKHNPKHLNPTHKPPTNEFPKD